ncbi:peptidase S24 [Petrimonas sulfuriphila]|uniref:LexA family protein n=1 Tax=Petrimonas sulfuriphila TaxID=285070 RepID=UPI00324B316D
MKKIISSSNLDFYSPEISELELPLVGEVTCGFPSPADDFLQDSIDLNKLLVKHPDATFYAIARGYSLSPLVYPGSILVIDKSVEWSSDLLACCYINGEFTVKWIEKTDDKIRLISLNKDFPVLEYTHEQAEVFIWGIVTAIVNKNVRLSRLQ